MSGPSRWAATFGVRRHRLRIRSDESEGTWRPGPSVLASSLGRAPAGWVIFGYDAALGGASLLAGEGRKHTLPPAAGSRQGVCLVGLPAARDPLRIELDVEPSLQAPESFQAWELGALPLFAVLLWLRVRDDGWRALPAALSEALRGRGPGRVLIEARLHAQRARLAAAEAQRGVRRPDESARRAFRAWARRRLEAFLAAGETLVLPRSEKPRVSVVVVAYDQAELTFACLESLRDHGRSAGEVVVWNNASTDRTRDLLEHTEGVVVHSDANIGFLRAVNEAVRRTRGDALLLINNDARLEEGSLEAALATLESSPDIAVVGGRVVFLDGRLQEAGSIVWRDGSCLGYGRGDDPEDPRYLFRRDVDYVSGVFFLARRRAWNELGGFDDAYAPAYYEEADFCLRAWRADWRVVYEPAAVAVHYEFGSAGDEAWAIERQRRNRALFVERHAEALEFHLPAADANVLAARSRPHGRRLLVLDDRVPHVDQGGGCPRLNVILRLLVKRGYEVTFYPTRFPHEETSGVYRDLPGELEILVGSGLDRLATFLAERRGHYPALLVSRPHNMASLQEILRRDPALLAGVRLVYDAEAIFALRDAERARLEGRKLPTARIDEEIALASLADRVSAVSVRERDLFVEHGLASRSVVVLPHAVEPRPTLRAFGERRGFLFVGPLREETTPNVDAVLWFLDEVFPRLRERLEPCELVVVGRNDHPTLGGRTDAGVTFAGRVDDLEPYYEAARVFVAPTRFAAGMPLKIYEASARGVPVAATDLLAAQLGWRDGEELLSSPVSDSAAFAESCVRLASDEALWERLRSNALARVADDCAFERVDRVLRRLLADDDADFSKC